MTDMATKRARSKCIATALVCQLSSIFFVQSEHRASPDVTLTFDTSTKQNRFLRCMQYKQLFCHLGFVDVETLRKASKLGLMMTNFLHSDVVFSHVITQFFGFLQLLLVIFNFYKATHTVLSQRFHHASTPQKCFNSGISCDFCRNSKQYHAVHACSSTLTGRYPCNQH